MAASPVNKLNFKVVYCSSEDPEYPADQLNSVSPNTIGWQSLRFCNYPQEIGLQFIDREIALSQIQILSHQSKISSKIEIFIGQGKDYETAKFKRLGYLSLDSNERSNFQARELKTVFFDHIRGSFIKFVINENYPNKQNIHNQVGIVAVSLLGIQEHNEDDDKYSNGKRNSYDPTAAKLSNVYNDLSVDMNLDPSTVKKLRQLADAKAEAITAEDYLTAKQIKSVESELRTLGSKLAQLDMAKSEAVMAEDYDLAKEIKDETDDLRREIENKIRSIRIPGVSTHGNKNSVPKYAPAKDETESPRVNQTKATSGNIINVDDIQVGKNGGGFPANYPGLSPRAGVDDGMIQKKVVKVESYDEGDDDNRSIRGADRDPFNVEKNKNIDHEKDVIIPRKMNDIDPAFPPGQHPLEGAPNFSGLPAPEPLSGKSKEISEQSGALALIGEYRCRCLFSKNWNLREAVVSKLHLMLNESELIPPPLPQGLNTVLPTIATIIKIGVEDKIQQVQSLTIDFMGDILKMSRSAKIPRSVIAPLFDPIIFQLLEKLYDTNARLRDGAKKGLDIATASANLGPAVVGAHALRTLNAKQKTGWRPLWSRLQLLTDLVSHYGVGGQTGLNVETILNFLKSNGTYSHSSGEVREGAKDLVVAIQKVLGTPAVESCFEFLRPKQKQEYLAAFNGSANPEVNSTPQNAGKNKSSNNHDHASQPRTDKHLQHPTHSPGGKVHTSAAKASDPYHQPNAEDVKQDFTVCMFCGISNPTWKEKDLDVHYWKDCPLLISCPSCAQIVEIAGLPEHLLDECDAKDSYVPCDVTGLAIRSTEFQAWKVGPNCTPAPANCMYCPLCLASVEDSDEAWLEHLTHGCPRNSRAVT